MSDIFSLIPDFHLYLQLDLLLEGMVISVNRYRMNEHRIELRSCLFVHGIAGFELWTYLSRAHWFAVSSLFLSLGLSRSIGR